MQERLDEEIVGAEIGDLKELTDKVCKNMEIGKTDNFTIASFSVDEVISLKGLKFRIKRINESKRTIELKLLNHDGE